MQVCLSLEQTKPGAKSGAVQQEIDSGPCRRGPSVEFVCLEGVFNFHFNTVIHYFLEDVCLQVPSPGRKHVLYV